MILGGLVAGLAFNLLEAMIGTLVTAKDFQAALSALGKRMPQTPGMMAYYVALGFVMGIALVWLYAAIRPRFGAGPGTAVKAGLAVWFIAGLIHAGRHVPPGGFLCLGERCYWLAPLAQRDRQRQKPCCLTRAEAV